MTALVNGEWGTNSGHAAGDLQGAISEYGADVVYASLVISDNYFAFAAVEQESVLENVSGTRGLRGIDPLRSRWPLDSDV